MKVCIPWFHTEFKIIYLNIPYYLNWKIIKYTKNILNKKKEYRKINKSFIVNITTISYWKNIFMNGTIKIYNETGVENV